MMRIGAENGGENGALDEVGEVGQEGGDREGEDR